MAHIPLLFNFFHKGLKPVKEYLFKEMKEYGYIKGKKIKGSAPTKKNKNINEKNNASSRNNFEVSDRQIMDEINYAPKTKTNKQKNGSQIKKVSYNKSNNRNIDDMVKHSKIRGKTVGTIKVNKNNKKNLKSVIVSKKKNKVIGYLPTQNLELENKIKINEKEKNNIFNLNLITINLNHKNKIIPNTSRHLMLFYFGHL